MPTPVYAMSSRQCEIAAEAFAASLLARSGYDVFVQYGANQPHYDLAAEKRGRWLAISVKGSKDGGWPLAPKRPGLTYHQSIDGWEQRQRPDVPFVFVQFEGVSFTAAPRVYVAKPAEIAAHLRSQCNGRGDGALHESHAKRSSRGYSHQIPQTWRFTQGRIDAI